MQRTRSKMSPGGTAPRARRRPIAIPWLLAGIVAAAPPPAVATTLREALVATYAGNPSLDAQRAALRAVDEQAAIARAGGRPQVSAGASYTRGLNGLRDLNGYNRALLAGASISVPVFQGGRVRNAVAAADIRSDAGRAELRAVEGDTFLEATTAYLDVLRDSQIVALNRENIGALGNVLKSSQARLREGDVTRTDLSQSTARAEQGDANLAAAEGVLAGSEQAYRRVIGLAPVALEMPAPLAELPASADEAVEVALAENAALAALTRAVDAGRRDVAAARATALPTLSVGAGSNYYSYRDRFAGIGNVSDDASQVNATLTVPLYQGGLVSAQVRQARNRVDEAIDRREAAERQVEAGARAAFASYTSALRTIAASERAVAANAEALKGVRIEADGGERQVLDVLNAELELLGSRVSLIRARHDAYLAGAQLLNVMGLLDQRHLGLAGPVYDPSVNFRHATRMRDDFSGRASRARMGYGPPDPR